MILKRDHYIAEKFETGFLYLFQAKIVSMYTGSTKFNTE